MRKHRFRAERSADGKQRKQESNLMLQNPELHYLDNAATTIVASDVADVIDRAMREHKMMKMNFLYFYRVLLIYTI